MTMTVIQRCQENVDGRAEAVARLGGTVSQQAYFAADNGFEAEWERLSTGEHLFDDITQDSLTRFGVSEGWRVLRDRRGRRLYYAMARASSRPQKTE